jgi:hypothetical protein
MGGLRGNIASLYGIHIAFLFMMGFMSWRKLKRKAKQVDVVDQEEIDVENATVYPDADARAAEPELPDEEESDSEEGHESAMVNAESENGTDSDGDGGSGDGDGGSGYGSYDED